MYITHFIGFEYFISKVTSDKMKNCNLHHEILLKMIIKCIFLVISLIDVGLTIDLKHSFKS